jgi:hypothetical protein
MESIIITSAQYVTDTDNRIIKAVIDGSEIFLSSDPDNRHYQAIQEWVAEGNTIQPAE